MYVNILKNDLKRKKTMNIILLLFTILAAMFVSSGLGNVITVMNGTNYFLDKAGIGDYMIITQNSDGGLCDILDKSKNVTSYKKEECYFALEENISVDNHDISIRGSQLLIQPIQKNGINFFDTDNTKVEKINNGEVYVTVGFLSGNDAKVGDTLHVELEGIDKKYKIAGEMKDAFLGSDMIGNTRILMSDKDYKVYSDNENIKSLYGNLFYINSSDNKALTQDLSDANNIAFSGDRDMIKMCYVMEMIVAMIVMVLSICLLIVSFVLLKFVITFTISEDYREIGVMKAIGISNFKIRSLYIVKYLAMSIVGGVIGFFVGIPFGNLLIKSVSEKMILGNDSGLVLNLIGSLSVVFIMIVFAYLCTGKVKKLSPIDAIRSGQTGERYQKKGVYSIGKSHFGNAFFMALNDILSAPRRFMIIILSFFLCSIFVFGVVEVTDTMKSDSLIGTFGIKSDVYIRDTKLLKMDYISSDGNDKLEKMYEDIEDDLEKMEISGKVNMEICYKYPITFEGDSLTGNFQQNMKTNASDYEYIKGSAPRNKYEIAITPTIAKQLDAEIGDEMTIDFGSEKIDCMIVGYFQSMNQLGSIMKLHEDAPTSMENATSMMGIQINFDEDVDEAELDRRIDKIKDYYDIEDVFDAAGYCDDCMGVADTMDAVSKLLLVITGIVVILVVVLMERSFILDEKNQIALLKAIGFKDSFIVKWHVYRFMIVTLVTEILAVALTYPVTKLWCDPVWKSMGATNVEYYFKPASLLIIYPGIILIINFVSVLLTSLYTRKIKSKDVTNIE